MFAPNPSRLLRVFLCHASEDKGVARQLHQRLSRDGFAPWLDEEDLLPGQKWRDEIPKAVRKSDVVVVCLSRHTEKEGYLQKEIKVALEVADEKPEGVIFVVPLRIEECEIPDRLREWHWVNYFEENGYEKLKQALRWRSQTLAPDNEISYENQMSAPVRAHRSETRSSEHNEISTIEFEFRQCIAEYRAFQQLNDSERRVVVDRRLASGVGRLSVGRLSAILESSPNDQETAMAVAVSLGVDKSSEDDFVVAQLLSDLLLTRFERVRYRAAYSIHLRAKRGNMPARAQVLLKESLGKSIKRESAAVVLSAMQKAFDAI
jgi:hypothetical protein